MSTFLITPDGRGVIKITTFEGDEVLTIPLYRKDQFSRYQSESYAVGYNAIYYTVDDRKIMSFDGRTSTEHGNIKKYHSLIEINGRVFGLNMERDEGVSVKSNAGGIHLGIKMHEMESTVNAGDRRYNISDFDGVISSELDLHHLDVNCEKDLRSGVWTRQGAWTGGSVWTTMSHDSKHINIAARDPREPTPRKLCSVHSNECFVLGVIGECMFTGVFGRLRAVYDPRADAVWYLERETYAGYTAYIV